MTTLRILLIEDHDLTRIGLRTALQQVEGFEVVAEAANGKHGLELLQKIQPDAALVDIGLPDLDGIELTRQFRQAQSSDSQSSTKILMLTMQDEEDAVLAAFAAGADSYCMKDIRIERLVEALRTTVAGQSWIDPIIASVVLQKIRKPFNGTAVPGRKVEINRVEPETSASIEDIGLTSRELEILQLIVDGYSNAAISEHLFITLGTVKTHVRNILNKLCASDRTQAAVLALRSGLIY
ncbi:MAG: response regulator transcription factor [Leptolyngbyaceae cyanobacterium bins.302]|nr:response regulator transcription factor [Leptolyngbyaceae cyanobacterium bins.302]